MKGRMIPVGTFVLGLIIGLLIMLFIRLRILEGGSSTIPVVVCEDSGMARASCTVTADAHYKVHGIYWKKYDEPGAPVDDYPDPSHVEFKAATTEGQTTSNFQISGIACSSENQDKFVVWPVFITNGGYKSYTFGPCTAP
jgi:hypothetical protein